MLSPSDVIPTLGCKDKKCWTDWLTKHHATSTGVWLQIAKKDSELASISYPDALEAALCQGWIDGQKKSGDAQSWLQKFTPRRPKSIWSKVNRDKAMALMAAGQMQAAGLAEVERAKADGRWEAAYDAQAARQSLRTWRPCWPGGPGPGLSLSRWIPAIATQFCSSFRQPVRARPASAG